MPCFIIVRNFLDAITQGRRPLEFQLLGSFEHLGLEGCHILFVRVSRLVPAHSLADNLAAPGPLPRFPGGLP